MSLEAFGDEGNVATHWEDTLIRSELDKVVERFDKWRNDYKDEMPSEDFSGTVDEINWAFDVLTRALTGKIE